MNDLAKKVVVNAVSIGVGLAVGLVTVKVVDIGKTIVRKFKKEETVKEKVLKCLK